MSSSVLGPVLQTRRWCRNKEKGQWLSEEDCLISEATCLLVALPVQGWPYYISKTAKRLLSIGKPNGPKRPALALSLFFCTCTQNHVTGHIPQTLQSLLTRFWTRWTKKWVFCKKNNLITDEMTPGNNWGPLQENQEECEKHQPQCSWSEASVWSTGTPFRLPTTGLCNFSKKGHYREGMPWDKDGRMLEEELHI